MSSVKKESIFDRSLREYLMTSFLIILVYELISKPIFSFLFNDVFVCKGYKNITNIDNLTGGMFDNITSMIACSFDKLVPKWLFSILPNANSFFLITIFSLALTGLLIGTVSGFAKFLFEHKKIKEYMHGDGRRSMYVSDFGAVLLLTFMIFSLIILVLYPIFGLIVFIKVIQEIDNRRTHKNEKLEEET